MSRTYQWLLVTRSNSVIITEPVRFRFLARLEAWRRNRANPGATGSVKENPPPRRASGG